MAAETYISPNDLDHLPQPGGPGFYRRVALVALVALVTAVVVCSQIPQVRGAWYRLVSSSEPPGLAWRDSFQAAVAESADAHKPLLLVFTSDSATSYVMMNEVWPSAQIRALGNNAFVPCRVKLDEHPDLAADFNVKEAPVAILVRENQPQVRLNGYLNADALAFELQRAAH